MTGSRRNCRSPKQKIIPERPKKEIKEYAGDGGTSICPEDMEVSMHAIEDAACSKTITFTGRRGRNVFSILVDGGSTHSFLDGSKVSNLKCELVKTLSMKVLGANRNHLTSQYECSSKFT